MDTDPGLKQEWKNILRSETSCSHCRSPVGGKAESEAIFSSKAVQGSSEDGKNIQSMGVPDGINAAEARSAAGVSWEPGFKSTVAFGLESGGAGGEAADSSVNRVLGAGTGFTEGLVGID